MWIKVQDAKGQTHFINSDAVEEVRPIKDVTTAQAVGNRCEIHFRSGRRLVAAAGVDDVGLSLSVAQERVPSLDRKPVVRPEQGKKPQRKRVK